MNRRGLALKSIVVVVTFALWTIGFGLADLADGFLGFVDQHRNAVLDAGWGAVFGVMLPLGLVAQLRHPARHIAGLQAAALIVAALAAAAVAGEAWRYLAPAAGLAIVVGVLAFLHPARSSFARGRGRTRLSLALLGAVAAVPCLAYAGRMASASRRRLPPLDATSLGLHHWPVMAALSAAVLFLVALAALDTRGWPIPASAAALGSLVWAISCLRYPDAAGSEGRGWAIAVLVWAGALLLTVVLERRRERPTGVAGRPTP